MKLVDLDAMKACVCIFACFDSGEHVLLEEIVVDEDLVGFRRKLFDKVHDVLALHLVSIIDANDIV